MSDNLELQITKFLALEGYPPFSDLDQFTSEQWFDFADLALRRYRQIDLSYVFRQFGLARLAKID